MDLADHFQVPDISKRKFKTVLSASTSERESRERRRRERESERKRERGSP